MKGKYANAAEKRRAQEALERRVAEGEVALEKAQAALRSETQRMSAEIDRLKERLREVTAEREAGQGPAVAQQESINRNLRQQMDALRERAAKDLKTLHSVTRGTHRYLMEDLGMPDAEARELILSFYPPSAGDADIPHALTLEGAEKYTSTQVQRGYVSSVGPSQRGNREAMLRIDVARGVRSAPSDVGESP